MSTTCSIEDKIAILNSCSKSLNNVAVYTSSACHCKLVSLNADVGVLVAQ